MKILAIILLASTLVSGQSEKKIQRNMITSYSHIKVGVAGNQVFCGITKVSFFFNNKHLILKSDHITLDLKVTDRTADKWTAIDGNKNSYTITSVQLNDFVGVAIIPNNQTAGILGVVMCNTYHLCE